MNSTKNLFELIFLLDGSASMKAWNREEILQGVKRVLNGFLALAGETLETKVSVYSVSGAYVTASPHLVRQSGAGPIEDEEMARLPEPKGSTPFYDRSVRYLHDAMENIDARFDVLSELESHFESLKKQHEEGQNAEGGAIGDQGLRKMSKPLTHVRKEAKLVEKLIEQHDKWGGIEPRILLLLDKRSNRLSMGLKALEKKLDKLGGMMAWYQVDGKLNEEQQGLYWEFLAPVDEQSGTREVIELIELVRLNRQSTPRHGVVINSLIDGMDNSSTEHHFVSKEMSLLGADARKKYSSATPSSKHMHHMLAMSNFKEVEYEITIQVDEEQNQVDEEQKEKKSDPVSPSDAPVVEDNVVEVDREGAESEEKQNAKTNKVKKKVTKILNPEDYQALLGLKRLEVFDSKTVDQVFTKLEEFNRSMLHKTM